jgi:hypothetical protein
MEILAIIGTLIVGLGFAFDKIFSGEKFGGCLMVFVLMICVFLVCFMLFLGWVM